MSKLASGLARGLGVGAFAAGLALASLSAMAQTPSPTTSAQQAPAAPTAPAAPPPAAQAAKTHTLSIKALGEGNPAAKGTEVWVLRFEGEQTRQAADVLKPAKGWISSNGSVVASATADPIEFKGVLAGAKTIVLLRHPWSGKVSITLDGKNEILDLYAPQSDVANINLDGSPTILAPVAAAAPAPAPAPAAAVAAPKNDAPAAKHDDTLVPGPKDLAWFGGGLLVGLIAAFILSRVARRDTNRPASL